jgi:hypothetical protein
MSPALLIMLGTAAAAALGVLGVLWLPYADAGTPAASHMHFFALAVTIINLFAPFAHGAYRLSTKTKGETTSGVIVGYFLAANTLITFFLFIQTYFGLSYAFFYGAQVVQWVVVLILGVAGNTVGSNAGTREQAAKIVSIRKQSLIDGLQQLGRSFPAGEDAGKKAVIESAKKIIEELKYFPSQEIRITLSSPFGRIATWQLSAESYLRNSVPSEPTPSALHSLNVEAGSIISALASYKG